MNYEGDLVNVFLSYIRKPKYNQSAASTVIGLHLKIERTQESKISAELFPRCISVINEYCSFDFQTKNDS